MAVPYSQSDSQVLDNHTYVKHSGSWRTIEDVQIKHSGSWRDVKEVHVKQSGSWRLVHEGEHFLFNAVISNSSQSEWSLSSHISGQGYGGNLIKGVVEFTGSAKRQRLNLGSFSSSSKVYVKIASNARILGAGGNGGNRGNNNGQGGQTAMQSSGTKFILNNAGVIGGGGGLSLIHI